MAQAVGSERSAIEVQQVASLRVTVWALTGDRDPVIRVRIAEGCHPAVPDKAPVVTPLWSLRIMMPARPAAAPRRSLPSRVRRLHWQVPQCVWASQSTGSVHQLSHFQLAITCAQAARTLRWLAVVQSGRGHIMSHGDKLSRRGPRTAERLAVSGRLRLHILLRSLYMLQHVHGCALGLANSKDSIAIRGGRLRARFVCQQSLQTSHPSPLRPFRGGSHFYPLEIERRGYSLSGAAVGSAADSALSVPQ